MTYHDLAEVLLRLWHQSDDMRRAQLGLVTSVFAKSTRMCWKAIYDYRVGLGVTPIEQLSPEDKKQLWDSTREIAPGLDRETMITVSKCLYIIELYLHEKSIHTRTFRESTESI